MKLSRIIHPTLAFLLPFLLIGTVGSMELDLISMREGILLCLLFLVLWVICTYRAGWFDWQNTPQEQEERYSREQLPEEEKAKRPKEGMMCR